jgi:Ca2+-binding RTX toxin-like protein
VFAAYIYSSAGGRHFFNSASDAADWGRDALANVEAAQFLDGVMFLETGEWIADLWLIDPAVFEGPQDPRAPIDQAIPADLLALGLPSVLGTAADRETVQGSVAAEILFGGGGAADVLVGGDGDDIHVATGVTVRIVETAGGGIDSLYSLAEWARLDTHVENLSLLGDGNSSGYGNALDNVLLGNTGRNRLDGGDGADLLDGGAGNDTLLGGAGADRFRFSGPTPGSDWIIGFDVAEDIVEIEQALIGAATITEVLAAAVATTFGTRIDVGEFHVTFGQIDPSVLSVENFSLI